MILKIPPSPFPSHSGEIPAGRCVWPTSILLYSLSFSLSNDDDDDDDDRRRLCFVCSCVAVVEMRVEREREGGGRVKARLICIEPTTHVYDFLKENESHPKHYIDACVCVRTSMRERR